MACVSMCVCVCVIAVSVFAIGISDATIVYDNMPPVRTRAHTHTHARTHTHTHTHTHSLLQILRDAAKSRREVDLHWRCCSQENIVNIIDVYENVFMGHRSLLVVMEW